MKYPRSAGSTTERCGRLNGTIDAIRNPFVLAFSAAAFLYVGVEAAIYVLDADVARRDIKDARTWLAVYGISIFFALRAAGRFLGAWMLMRLAVAPAPSRC